MVKAVYDRIWITPLESKGSVYVVQSKDAVFVVSKCCGFTVVSRGRGRDYYCTGCMKDLAYQPGDRIVNDWSLSGYVSWPVVPGWISTWVKIPKDDLTVIVDGAIIE